MQSFGDALQKTPNTKNICGQRKLKVSSTKLHNQGSPSFPPGQVTQATVLIGMGAVEY